MGNKRQHFDSQLFKKILPIPVVIFFACLVLQSCGNSGAKSSATDSLTVNNKSNGGKDTAAAQITPRRGTDTNCILPHMIFVKGGSFKMGDNTSDRDEDKPEHTVHLSNFWIGKYEVTVAEFRRFMNTGTYITDAEKEGHSYVFDGKSLIYRKAGINWQHDILGKLRVNEEDHPVIHISRNDAMAYCKWLSKQTGKSYRLLTEAEWEYAAKGGPRHDKFIYSGSNILDSVGWYSGNSGLHTHPVGTRAPNGLGIHDMSGNVWEWCSDWSGPYDAAEVTNPTGPEKGTNGVVRGGAWRWYDITARCTSRRDPIPNFNASGMGFRLASSEAKIN